jgi:sterol desaturase/sphingolipid hydroxylase (fatty acid hydroxylase superfamily)
VAEMLIVGWRRSSLYQLRYHFKLVSNDFFGFVIEVAGLYQLIGMLFYGGIFYYLYGQIQKNFCFHLIDHIPGHVLQFAVIFVIADFKDYWIHWFTHNLAWAWELHKLHHSAERMTMLTSFRTHPAENVLTNFMDLFPFIIFGAPAETFALVYLFRQVQNYFIHSQIDSEWGWLGRYILMSPAAHRLHHSMDPAHYGKNLGSRFIFWDKLFGTYYPIRKNEVYQMGIPDNEFNKKGFIYDLLSSYKKSMIVAKNSFIRIFKQNKHQ